MRIKNVILDRSDLIRSSREKPCDDITVSDVSGSYRRIMDADTVVFLDDKTPRIITIKSRYWE